MTSRPDHLKGPTMIEQHEYAIQLTYQDGPSFLNSPWSTDEKFQRQCYDNAVQGTKSAKVELLRRPVGAAEVVETNRPGMRSVVRYVCDAPGCTTSRLSDELHIHGGYRGELTITTYGNHGTARWFACGQEHVSPAIAEVEEKILTGKVSR